MVITKLAYVFGVVLVVIGVLGFFPVFAPAGKLFGLFAVNAHHNLVHIVTGAFGLAAAYNGDWWSSVYFKVVGVVYVLMALIGFMHGNGMLFDTVNNNAMDTWLHVVIGVVSVYLGFFRHCHYCHKDKE